MSMRSILPTLLLSLAFGFGCAADSVGEHSGAVRITTQCTVAGVGTLPAGDDFDGTATGAPDGFASGTWEHFGPPRPADEESDDCRGVRRGHHEGRGQGHDRHQGRGVGHDCGCHDDDGSATTRDHLIADVDTVTCFINGSRVGVVTGSGEWNGVPGHTFEVSIIDGGSTDEYSLDVFDSSGALVYQTTDVPDSGDITLTEP